MSEQAPIDTSSAEAAPWRNPRLSPAERAGLLVPLMTLEEKVHQLVGMWIGAGRFAIPAQSVVSVAPSTRERA